MHVERGRQHAGCPCACLPLWHPLPVLPTRAQGVGTIVGELAGLCGSRLPGSERVVACGNSFGRGPLVYHFPEAAVAALRKRWVPLGLRFCIEAQCMRTLLMFGVKLARRVPM